MIESSGSILQLPSKPVLSNVNLLIVSNQSTSFKAIASCLEVSDISFSCDLIDPDQESDQPGWYTERNLDCPKKLLTLKRTPVDQDTGVRWIINQQGSGLKKSNSSSADEYPDGGYKLSNELEKQPSEKYSAIIYDYTVNSEDNQIESLISQLQWWRNFHLNTPLVIVTDVLGDEAAARLMQSGVDGYVLRDKLDQLPNILNKTIVDFASKQAIVHQQQDLIKQQQYQLQQLQGKIKIHSDAAKTQEILLAQQQKVIDQQENRLQQLETEIQSWIDGEQAKQEHLAHLNHELRSPISSMLGFAGMLKEQYYGELNERQMRYVNAMLSVGQYMLDLVNNYLDIAKIDANKHTLELERLAVDEVCENAKLFLEEKARQKDLEFDFDLADDIDFCTADSRCLRQILINLLSNAIKFTETGKIALQVYHDADFLNFAVIDTGTGIATENMTKLFKPFPQISNHHESTGLGLALSRKLARLHGGDIKATSELGKGSCFTLSIPRFNKQ